MAILKRSISFLLVCVMLLGLVPAAKAASPTESGFCGAEGDNIKWELYLDGNWYDLVLTGSGAMAEWDEQYQSYSMPWAYYASSIKSVTIADGITSISDGTFSMHRSLAEISIPDSVTFIGSHAFDCCDNLPEITLHKGLTEISDSTFAACTALTAIDIPEGVTRIGQNAFDSCTGLEDVFIPNTVCEIDGSAFRACTALADVTIPESVTFLGYFSFAGCLSLKSATFLGDAPSLEKYLEEPFTNCASDFTIYYSEGAAGWSTPTWNGYPAYPYDPAEDPPDVSGGNSGSCGAEGSNVTWTLDDNGTLIISGSGAMVDYTAVYNDTTGKIDTTAPWYDFRGKISSIIVEDGITHVGSYAFYSSEKATSAEIADSVKTISSYAFSGCAGLSSLDLGSGVQAICDGAFDSCSSLSELVIPNSVQTIGTYAFWHCTALTELNLGSVQSIGSNAFNGCNALTELVIPNSVTTLMDGAFASCLGLKNITIGKGVTTLPYSCFLHNVSLTEITIPSNVQTINTGAFLDCTALEKVTLTEGLQSIGYEAFKRCALESIVIPASVTKILGNAFSGCGGLSVAIFNGDAPDIGANAFHDSSEEFFIYYPKDASGWTTPTWNGYPAYPYNPNGVLPETWPTNQGAHVIIAVDSEVGSDGEVRPIVGATVKILTRSGAIQTGVTDENGQFAYGGQDGLEIRIEAEGYQILRSAYVMNTGEARLFQMKALPDDGVPYFSMLSARARVGVGIRSVDLQTDAVYYTEGHDTGLQLMFEVAKDYYTQLVNIQLFQNPVDYKHEGRFMTFDYTGGNDAFHIEDGTFTNHLYQIAPGRFRSQEQIYAVIHYKLPGAPTTYNTEPIPLSLNIEPLPEPPSADAQNSMTLTAGTQATGSVRWIDQILLNIDHALFHTYLGSDPSIESDLLNFAYTVETDSKTGNRTVQLAIGINKDTMDYSLFTNKAGKGKSETPFQEMRDWINSAQMEAGKPLDFFKDKLNKEWKKGLKTSKLKSMGEFEGEVIGYYEGEIDPNGNIIPEKSKGRLLVSFAAKATTGRTVLVSGFPLYFEASAAMKISAAMNPSVLSDPSTGVPTLKITPSERKPGSNQELVEITMTLPEVSLEGGVGVRGVATVGVGGVFENAVTFTISSAETTTRLVGSTNAFFRVYVAFLVDYKQNFGDRKGGKIVIFDTKEMGGKNGVLTYTAGKTIAQQALAAPTLELTQREYLTNASRWSGNPIRLMNTDSLVTLQNGVLPNAMPKLVTLGSRELLLFLADDATRSLGANTRLMYSVRENGVWSEPRALWESTTADLYFDSAVVDGQLWVVWQKVRGTVTGEDAMSMLASQSAQSEICLARWDDGQDCFVEQQYLTDNETVDMMASVCAADGGIQVTWVSNDENNVLGTGGTNTIHTLTVRDGTPGQVQDLYTTTRFLTELRTLWDHDGLHLLFGTLDEENHTDLNHLSPGGLIQPMTDGSYAGLRSENSRFLWQSEGILWRYSPRLGQYEALISSENGSVSSSYRYVANGDREAVVWCEGQEPTRIMASVLCDGQWSEPVVLIDDINETITFLDAALTDDGSFVLVVNTAVFVDEETRTALKTAVITPMADVSILDVRLDTADPETGTQPISVQVENVGLMAVDELHLTVNGSGTLLDTVCPVELAPGGNCTITGLLDVSGITGLTEIDIQAQASTDANIIDNYTTAYVGYTDAALSIHAQELNDTIFFLLTASNSSAIRTNASVRVYQGSLDGQEQALLPLGTVTRGENIQYLYTLDKNAIDFGGETSVNYLFSLETGETDRDDSDNLQVYTVCQPPELPEPPQSAGEELVMVQPESVEILNGDISFSDPSAAPAVLEIRIMPEDSSITEVFWSVGDPDVALVLPDGTVIPSGSGTTTITATLTDTLSDTITVTVGEAEVIHTHTPALDIGYPATCTEDGRTDGSHCCQCGEILAAQEILHALGHDWDGTICRRCGEQRSNPFTDVPEGSFYYDPVIWAVENGITNGTTPTTFGPNDQCMRAHVVTFLWRAAGSPEPSSSHNPFVDVMPSDFYYQAVLWAVENGITNGLDATHFGPFAYCNRAQVVTFLHRALGNPEPSSQHNPFTDVPEGSFYHKPVLWAVENAVTNGLDATHFGPDSICNRAQIVTFLYRAFT